MRIINEIILFLIQWIHWTVLILTGTSFFLVWILEPWYVALPISIWIMHLGFSRTLDCPWTRLENVFLFKSLIFINVSKNTESSNDYV